MDQPVTAEGTSSSPQRPFNPGLGLQGVLVLEVFVRMFIWSAALAATVLFASRYGLPKPMPGPWPMRLRAAWDFSQSIVLLVIVYNAAYLFVLFALRLLIPQPRPGRYSMATRRPDPALIWSCLIAILTKARYQAPFPAILVPQLANVFPFHWLFRWRFGPRSRSPFFVEPNLLDPTWTTVGRNVTIGFGTTIAGHLQERDTVTIAPTIIEDDVLIGAHTAIPGNVHIKRGAVIRGFSMILPGTVIPENEFWGGIPARRIKRLDEYGAVSESPPEQRDSGAAVV